MKSTSNSVPFKAAKHLGMAEELSEVDVKHVTGGAQHDVVIVAIADAQHVSCHTASGTRIDEIL